MVHVLVSEGRRNFQSFVSAGKDVRYLSPGHEVLLFKGEVWSRSAIIGNFIPNYKL